MMKRKQSHILYLGLDPSRYPHDGKLVHLPLIRTHALAFEGSLKKMFENLELYSHVLFTSRTAISIYMDYAQLANISDSILQCKIYLCVGKATAACLSEKGLHPSFTAQQETGEGVVALLKNLSLKNAHFFFPKSAKARTLITDYLKSENISCDTADLYDTVFNQVVLPDLEAFDELVFTSPSTVHAFFALAPKMPLREKCICIGPITENALKEYFLRRN